LDWSAWELAAGGRRITPAASGLHGQWVIALNGFSCSGCEGRRIGMNYLGRRDTGQYREEQSRDEGEETLLNVHVFIDSRFLAGVKFGKA
jgi:hypothetical protein